MPLLLFLILLAATSKAYDHRLLFPDNDEYEFNTFDISDPMATHPFGGFSRAAASRLAALPLHLHIDNLDDTDDTYFRQSDFQGREFVCKVYKQKELVDTTSSMFNTAVLKYESSSHNDRLSFRSNLRANLQQQYVPQHVVDIRSRLAGYEGKCVDYSMIEEDEDNVHTSKTIAYKFCFFDHVRQSIDKYSENGIIVTRNEAHFLYQTVTEPNTYNNNGYVVEQEFVSASRSCIVPEDYDSDAVVTPLVPFKVNVTLVCCDGEGDDDSLLSMFYDEEASFRCSVALQVCVPKLCKSYNIVVGSDDDGIGLSTKEDDSKTSMSVRTLLATKFLEKKKCLLRNEGWWKYEFCYHRSIRQFHPSAVGVDPTTGATSMVIDTQHILGSYDVTKNSHALKDESLQIVNSTALSSTEKPRDIAGNGSVFIEEYTGGDLCVGDDVDKSYSTVHREVTVRYFCGTAFEISDLKEDTTCHYVLDISVPDLCDHPLFQASETKEADIVKCLPIEALTKL